MIIALNILFVKEKEIYPTFISKTNSNCKMQIIILIISDVEKEGIILL